VRKLVDAATCYIWMQILMTVFGLLAALVVSGAVWFVILLMGKVMGL